MKKLIVIADWGNDLLTCQEIRSAVEGSISEYPHISFVASTPSTVHASFLVNQVVEIEERFGRPENTVIFENTDPRLQTNKSVDNAQGANFIIVKLQSGIMLCGPNAGYCFSMIKQKIEKLWIYRDFNRGSQFRSRDFYAKASAQLIESRMGEMELEQAAPLIIPDLQGTYIGHIDNYGNIKTTIVSDEFQKAHAFGESIEIEINGVKKWAKFVINLFGGVPGELVIYPGSSGKRENPFLEISVWRHFTEKDSSTGFQAFNNPKPGDEIKIY